MESIAQPVAEFTLENLFANLAEVIAPYVEIVARLTPIACEYAACAADAIQQYFESFGTSTGDAICGASIDAAMLGKRNGLSDFDKLAGRLMSEARSRCGKRLPAEEYGRIAEKIDEAKFRPLDHFEGNARARLAANNKNARMAIHSFRAAIMSKGHSRRGAKRRLYRAYDKWTEAYPLSGR